MRNAGSIKSATSSEKSMPDLPGKARPGLPQRIRQICIHLWLWELLSLSLCVACVGAIVILLLRYDDKPLPQWQYGLTINGVISVLAGVAKASMILPVAECISQLKWHWFWNAPRRPLMDFQYLDAASRGPWGCLILLCRPRQWSASSLGALITVAALLMEPSLQFIPEFPTRMAAKGVATLERSLEFNDTSIFDSAPSWDTYVASPFAKSALYSAMYSHTSDKIAATVAACPTGNCTWPSYSSLAVCNSCTNMTAAVTRNNNNSGWMRPHGLMLFDDADFVLRLPSAQQVLYGQNYNSSLIIVDYLLQDRPGNGSYSRPQAYECVLYFCVKTMSTSMSAGVFTEETESTWPDPHEKPWDVPNLHTDQGMSRVTPKQFQKDALLQPPGGDDVYRVDAYTAYLMKWWLGNLFNSLESLLRVEAPVDETDQDLLGALQKRLVQNMHAVGGPAQVVMDSLADGFTAAIRRRAAENVVVKGTAFGEQTFVRARWGWAVLPTLLVAMTCLFLGATLGLTIRRGVPIWKSSALATLAHGLDDEAGRCVSADKLDAIEEKAAHQQVAIDSDDGVWNLKGRGASLVRSK